MSKDGPPSGRMTFGYKQARDAGAPYVAPRSTAEVNLEAFLSRHPQLRERVAELRKERRRSDKILEELREEGWDGRFCLDRWRDADRENHLGSHYEHDRKILEDEAAWGFSAGVYKAVVLSELHADTGEWTEIRWWPPELEDQDDGE